MISFESLNTFDRHVFESIIEKVVVGGVDKEGNNNSHKLTFINKIGNVDSVDGNNFKPPRKNKKRGFE